MPLSDTGESDMVKHGRITIGAKKGLFILSGRY
jgi:hypothetical protein